MNKVLMSISGAVAEWLERRTRNMWIRGSNPSDGPMPLGKTYTIFPLLTKGQIWQISCWEVNLQQTSVLSRS